MSTNNKIRVLHFICSTGFYGAEKWILALVNNQNNDAVHSELVVTKEVENQDLELTRAYRAMGHPMHEIPMSFKFDFRAVTALAELIRERQIDIIHTHGYKSDILGVLAARKAGIKSIATPHGFEKLDDWKLNLFIGLGCRSFKYFDYVAPLSRELCDDVRRYNVDEEKIVYIRNGVDLKGIDFRLPSNNPTRKTSPTIGFIGQLIGRKNVGDILDVFDAIAKEHPQLKLVLLGDGDAREKYQQYAQHCSNADRIEFLGFVNQPLDYLSTFDLFVMTSTLEGIPRCLMESMAAGVPVAAYDIPGVDQLIESDKNGLLAPLGDKQKLTECWNKLLWDDALADSIASAAAQTVNEKFSAQRMANEYLDLYRRTVDDAPIAKAA
ncbi:MAG: glycosyltransferase family 4 protein [Pseudomonadota bacterium]